MKWIEEHPILKAYEDHILTLTKENKKLRKTLEAAQQNDKENENKITELEKNIEELVLKVNSELENDNEFSSMNRVERSIKENIITTFRERHNALLKEISDGKERIAKLEAENKESKKLLEFNEDSTKKDIKKIKELESLLEEYKNKCKLLKEKLNFRVNEGKEIQEERLIFTNRKIELESKISTLKSSLEKLTSEKDRNEFSLNRRIKELEAALDSAELDKKALESKCTGSEHKQEILEKTNKELVAEINQIKEDFSQMAKMLEEDESKVQELTNLLDQSKEKQKEYSRKLDDCKAKLELSILNEAQYQRQINSLEQKLRRVADDVKSEYDSNTLKLEIKSKTEIAEQNRKYARLNEEFKELTREHEELKDNYAVLKRGKDSLEMRNEEERSMNALRIKKLEDNLEATRSELDTERITFEKELQDSKLKLSNQMKEYMLKLKEEEIELRQVRSQLNEMRTRCEELTADKNKQQERINALTTELTMRDNEYERRTEELISDYKKKVRTLEMEKEYSSGRAMTGEEKIKLLLRQEQALCDKWRTDYYKMSKHYEGKVKDKSVRENSNC